MNHSTAHLLLATPAGQKKHIGVASLHLREAVDAIGLLGAALATCVLAGFTDEVKPWRRKP
jgi:hypothetical protein